MLTSFTLHPFIILSVTFHSLIERTNNFNKSIKTILSIIIHIIYNTIISLVIGIPLSILIIISLTAINLTEYLNASALLTGPSFLFVCLNGILLLNLNERISIPITLFKMFVVLSNIDAFKNIVKTYIFLTIISLILSFISIPLLISLSIPSSQMPLAMVITFLIAFLVTIFLYSESSINPLIRRIRQFIVWTGLFIFLLILSFVQLYFYLAEGFNTQSIIVVAILIFNLPFSMAYVIDRARLLYEAVNKDFEESISIIWKDLEEKYSVTILLKLLNQEKLKIFNSAALLLAEWKNNKIQVLKRISIITPIIIIYFLTIFNTDCITIIIDKKIEILKNFWIKVFKGNNELAQTAFIFVLLSCALIWSALRLIKNFKKCNWEGRYSLIGLTIFILFLFLVTLRMVFIEFNTSLILIDKAIFSIGGLFILMIYSFPLIEWLIKRRSR